MIELCLDYLLLRNFWKIKCKEFLILLDICNTPNPSQSPRDEPISCITVNILLDLSVLYTVTMGSMLILIWLTWVATALSLVDTMVRVLQGFQHSSNSLNSETLMRRKSSFCSSSGSIFLQIVVLFLPRRGGTQPRIFMNSFSTCCWKQSEYRKYLFLLP